MFKIFYKFKQNNIFQYMPKRNILLPPRKSNFDSLKTSIIVESKLEKIIGVEQIDAPFKSNLRPESFYTYYYKLKRRAVLSRLFNIKNNKQENFLPREPYPNCDSHFWDWKNFLFFKSIRKFTFYDCKESDYFNYRNRFKITKYYNFIYKNGNSYSILNKKLLKKFMKNGENSLNDVYNGLSQLSTDILNSDKFSEDNFDHFRLYYYFFLKFFFIIKNYLLKITSLNVILKYVFSLSNVYLDLFNYYKKKGGFTLAIADKYFFKYNWDFISSSKTDSLTSGSNLSIKYLYNSKLDIRKNQLKWNIHVYPTMMLTPKGDYTLRDLKCPKYIIGMFNIHEDIILDFVPMTKTGAIVNRRKVWKKLGSFFRRIYSGKPCVAFSKSYKYPRGPIILDTPFINAQKTTIHFSYKHRYLLDKFMYAKKRRLSFKRIPVEKLKRPWLLPSIRRYYRFSYNLPEHWIKTIGFIIYHYINNFFPKQNTFLYYRFCKKKNFFSFYKNFSFYNYVSLFTNENNIAFNSSESQLSDNFFFNVLRTLRCGFYYIDWLNFPKLNSVTSFFNQFICRNQIEKDLSFYLYKTKDIICLLNKYNNPSVNVWTVYKFIEFFGNFFFLSIYLGNIDIKNKLIYSRYCDSEHFFFLKKSFLYLGQKFSSNSYLSSLGSILVHIENSFKYLSFLFKFDFDIAEFPTILFNINFFDLKKILKLLDLFLESTTFSFTPSYVRWVRNKKGEVIRETTRNLWLNTHRNSKYLLVCLFKRYIRLFYPKFSFLKKFFENGFKILSNIHTFYSSFIYSSSFFWPVDLKEYSIYNNKLTKNKLTKYFAFFDLHQEEEEEEEVEGEPYIENNPGIKKDTISEHFSSSFSRNSFINHIIEDHGEEVLLPKINTAKTSCSFFKSFFLSLFKNYLALNNKIDHALLFFILNVLSYFFLISLIKEDLILVTMWNGFKNNFVYMSESTFNVSYKSINYKIEKLLQYWLLSIFDNIKDGDYFPIFLEKFKLILNHLRVDNFKINFLNSNFFRESKIFINTSCFTINNYLKKKDFYSKGDILHIVNNTPSYAAKSGDYVNMDPIQIDPYWRLSLNFNSFKYTYVSDYERGYNIKAKKHYSPKEIIRKNKIPVLNMKAYEDLRAELHKGLKRSKIFKKRIKMAKFKFCNRARFVTSLNYNFDNRGKHMLLLKKNKYEMLYDQKRIKYDYKFLIKNKVSNLIKNKHLAKSFDFLTDSIFISDEVDDQKFFDFEKFSMWNKESFSLDGINFSEKKIIKNFIDYKINNPFTITNKAAKNCFYVNFKPKRRSFYLINRFRLNTKPIYNFKIVSDRKKQLLNILKNKNIPFFFKKLYFYDFNVWGSRFDLYNHYALGFNTHKKFKNDGINLHNYYRKRDNRVNLKQIYYFDTILPRVKYQRKKDPKRDATIKVIRENQNAYIYIFSKKIYTANLLNKMEIKTKKDYFQFENLMNKKNKISDILERSEKNYLNYNSIFYITSVFKKSLTAPTNNFLNISKIQKKYFVFLNKIRNTFSLIRKFRSMDKEKNDFLIDNRNIFTFQTLFREHAKPFSLIDMDYIKRKNYFVGRGRKFLGAKHWISFIKNLKNPNIDFIERICTDYNLLNFEIEDVNPKQPKSQRSIRHSLASNVPTRFYKKLNYLISPAIYHMPFIKKKPKPIPRKLKTANIAKLIKPIIFKRTRRHHKVLRFFFGGTASSWSIHWDKFASSVLTKRFFKPLRRSLVGKFITYRMRHQSTSKSYFFPYFHTYKASNKRLSKMKRIIKEDVYKISLKSEFKDFWLTVCYSNCLPLRPFTNSRMWWSLFKEKLVNSSFNKYINWPAGAVNNEINFTWRWRKINPDIKKMFHFCPDSFTSHATLSTDLSHHLFEEDDIYGCYDTDIDGNIVAGDFSKRFFFPICHYELSSWDEYNLNFSEQFNNYFKIDNTENINLPLCQRTEEILDFNLTDFRLKPVELEFLYDYQDFLNEEPKVEEDPEWVYNPEGYPLEYTKPILTLEEMGIISDDAEVDKRWDNEKDPRIRSWDLDERNPINIRAKEIAENWEIQKNAVFEKIIKK